MAYHEAESATAVTLDGGAVSLLFPENARQIFCANAAAGVFNFRTDSPVFVCVLFQRQSGGDMSFLGKFDGIADQVDQYLTEAQSITMN